MHHCFLLQRLLCYLDLLILSISNLPFHRLFPAILLPCSRVLLSCRFQTLPYNRLLGRMIMSMDQSLNLFRYQQVLLFYLLIFNIMKVFGPMNPPLTSYPRSQIFKGKKLRTILGLRIY